MVFQNNLLAGVGGQGGAAAYDIPYSCRFNTADTAVLSRANGTATSSTTATIAFWFKMGVLTAEQAFFGAEGFYTGLAILVGKTLQLVHGDGAVVLTTTQVFRDPSAWYHCMVVFDTTESVSTDRARLYINGLRVTDYTATTFPTKDEAFTAWNTSGNTNLVGDGHSTKANFDGYLSEFHSTDGTAYGPEKFGEFNNGVWRPIEVSGVTYGNNGFYFDFADSSDLGNDVSGNDNDFTSSGLAANDQMDDTPTTNYAVWNVLNEWSDNVFSDGNLTITTLAPGYFRVPITTIGATTGKFYCEMSFSDDGASNDVAFGIDDGKAAQGLSSLTDNTSITGGNFIGYKQNGEKYIGATTSAFGATYTAGDVIGIALDLDDGTPHVEFYKNNSSEGTVNLVTTGIPYFFAAKTFTGAAVYTANFGQSAFTYTPPTGFVALNTANIAEPTIKNSKKYFDTILYEGNSLSQKVGQFQPIAETYSVGSSAVFIAADSCFLSRTPTILGNRRTGSISLWHKRGTSGSIMQLFNSGAGDDITFNASDKLTFADSSGVSYITTQTFKDVTQWNHLLFAWDTTLAVAGDRLRIYHNGTEITAFDTETNPSQYDSFEISNTVRQTIGANESDTEEFDGYMSEVYLVDGQQLTPSSFGEVDSTTNRWIPKEYSGGGSGISGDAIPDMTSNTAPSGVASASAEEGASYAAWKAFDKDSTTYWSNYNDGVTAFLQYQFSSAKTITNYTITSRQTGATGPTDWTFQGSNDGSDYTTLDTVTGQSPVADVPLFFTCDTTGSYTYYKLAITGSTSTYIELKACQMMEASSGYGTNGFYLDYADKNDLGDDESGNGNDYAESGFDTTNGSNQFHDTPTRNFSTLSPAFDQGMTLTNGNTVATNTGTDLMVIGQPNMAMTTGKWYVEMEAGSGATAGYPMTGIRSYPSDAFASGYVGDDTYSVGLYTNDATPDIYHSSVVASLASGGVVVSGDVVQLAFDADTGDLWWGINNTWLDNSDGDTGDPATGAYPHFNAGSLSSTTQGWLWGFTPAPSSGATSIVNSGSYQYFDGTSLSETAAANGFFRFTPPTGFKGLNNDSLTESDSFQSAFSWIKNRDALDSFMLFDRVRGPFSFWHSDDDADIADDVDTLTRFLKQGANISDDVRVNTFNESYVYWDWFIETTGSGTGNGDGSISTALTLVDTTSGLSISKFTGTGANATVGHGLGVAPKFVILKHFDNTNYSTPIWHNQFDTPTTGLMYLDTGDAESNAATAWNSTIPTSSVVSLGTGASTNNSGTDYIMYAFAEVEGFSSFGKYLGNGLSAANGPFAYTGFKPELVAIKGIDATRSWMVLSSKFGPNPNKYQLLWDTNGVQGATYDAIDFLSNGFRVVNTVAYNDMNVAAQSYVFMAWATNPFGGASTTPGTAF